MDTNIILDTGNTAWMIVATLLVLLMTIPGIALFYGGLVRQKNVLSIIMQCMLIVCAVTISKAKTSSKNNGQVNYSCLSLRNSAVSIDVNASVEEKAFLDIIINEALKSEKRVLSDDVVLNLIVESANKYKCREYANTENGKLIQNHKKLNMEKKN